MPNSYLRIQRKKINQQEVAKNEMLQINCDTYKSKERMQYTSKMDS
jgi:hypothetical protein